MQTRDVTRASVLIALGVILPLLFHFLGIPGRVFLPMHIPAILGGFLLKGQMGFLVGFMLPPLNFLVSGMPPFPVFLSMMVELGAYGLTSSLLFQVLQWGIVPSLLGAMLVGRGIAILGNWVLFSVLGKEFNVFSLLQSLFVTALPGILIQIVLIPLLVALILRWEKGVARSQDLL